jgi:hypothetical protein
LVLKGAKVNLRQLGGNENILSRNSRFFDTSADGSFSFYDSSRLFSETIVLNHMVCSRYKYAPSMCLYPVYGYRGQQLKSVHKSNWTLMAETTSCLKAACSSGVIPPHPPKAEDPNFQQNEDKDQAWVLTDDGHFSSGIESEGFRHVVAGWC